MAFPFRVLLQVVLSLFSWFFDAYWLILTSNKFFFLTFADFLFLCLEVVICRYFEPFLFLLDELPLWIINRRLWWLLSGTIVVGGRVIFLDWSDIKNWPELFACLKTIGPPQKSPNHALQNNNNTSKLHLFLRGIFKCREFLRHIHITIGDFFFAKSHYLWSLFGVHLFNQIKRKKKCNVTMNFLPQISQTYETLKHLGVVGFRKVVGGWTGVSQRGKKTLAGWKPMISWMGKNWSCDLIWSLVPCQPLGFGAL